MFLQSALAQQSNYNPNTSALKHKRVGKFFFHWGYNRSWYSKSDIQVKGGGYDFTVYDVKATDDPEPFESDAYYRMSKITIPQFNFRVGYCYNERWSFSIGWDHLKYRTSHVQEVQIAGDYIRNGQPIRYNGETVKLTRYFFHLEHTDGLNFVRLQADYAISLIQTKNKKQGVDAILGAGFGPVCPWSDAIIDGVRHRSFVRPSGVGASVDIKLRARVFPSFFVQSTARIGAIRLNDILITDEIRAKQSFNFGEFNITAGFIFGLKQRR